MWYSPNQRPHSDLAHSGTSPVNFGMIRPPQAAASGKRWKPSRKEYPSRPKPPNYPGHFEVRRVSACGTFRMKSGQYYLSKALLGEDVGFEEVDDEIWNIVYYNTILGRIALKTGKITGNEKV